MHHPSHIEVDLQRLSDNVRWWQRHLAPASAQLCGVVKADGYGLGAAAVTEQLVRDGVERLAVYTPSEAHSVLGHVGQTPVIVLMPVREADLDASLHAPLHSGQLQLCIHDVGQLESLATFAKREDVALTLHLFIDTGMSRGGLSDDDLSRVAAQLIKHPLLKVAGICTHFCSSESDAELTTQQMQRLQASVTAHRNQLPKNICIHAANTQGALRDPATHAQMARIGLGLWGLGLGDFFDSQSHGHNRPLPIMRWLAPIVHTQWYDAGTTVGYGCTHKLTSRRRLALVPVGYGAGYPWSAGNRGAMMGICGAQDDATQYVPVLGRVNMDQTVVDVTDVPAAVVGSEVEVIGSEPGAPNSATRLAQVAETIEYEILTRLSAQVSRKYLSAETVPSSPPGKTAQSHD